MARVYHTHDTHAGTIHLIIHTSHKHAHILYYVQAYNIHTQFCMRINNRSIYTHDRYEIRARIINYVCIWDTQDIRCTCIFYYCIKQ
jgi:hypothetical protein